ncbi:MAG: type II secretion system F family protein, partial [Conexivisphaerales archaeon]
ARNSGEDILRAGVNSTPHAFYYKWVNYGLWSLIAVIPVSFALAFILKNPIPLIALSVPLFVVFIIPSVSLKSTAGDRKRAIEDELPFFTLYVSTLADAGISLYDAMKRLIGRGVFQYVERDAVYLERSVEFMGQDQLSAVDMVARSHPSKSMRDLLYGYSSELRSGGDIANYFTERAESLLNWLEFRFSKYGDSVSDLGEMMTAMFFIFPTLVIASAFISPVTSITLVWLMSALIIPVMGVVIIFMIRQSQPKTGDVYNGDLRTGLIAGAVSGIAVFFLRLPIWAPMAAALVAGSLAFSVPVYIQKRVANDEERSLEGFVRDITEYRKSGYDITRAIRKLSIEGRYTPAFTNLLKRVAASLALGSRLPEINVRANSWVVKQIFFLLGEVEDSGGGSPKELEAIHTFVEKFALAKSMVKSRMRIYEMLTLATPAGLAVLIFVMGTFIKVLGSGGMALGGLISTSVPPSLISASYVMVIVSAVFMALSAGVASDFTVKNMWRVALSVLLASVVIFALTTFGGAITSLLPTSL